MSHVNRGADLDDIGPAPEQPGRPDPVFEEPFVIKYVRPCVAEALQLTIFVFVGTTAVCVGATTDLTGIAIAHGLTIALLIMGFGAISGGHINPAVTLGVTLAGGLSPIMAIPYIVSQLIGSIIGAGLCRAVVGDFLYAASNGGAQIPEADSNDGEAVVAEIVATMILVGSVLLTAVDSGGKNPVAPFAIGFSVLVDILAVGPVSGASMNPARTFGPCVMLSMGVDDSDSDEVWKANWIYWIGPIVGALIAAAFYRFLFAKPENRLILKPKIA